MTPAVLIIGAGPAGSALAIHLLRKGLQVTLVDRAQFPREKPCGEFLSPECRPYLAELGLAQPEQQLGAATIRGMRISGYGATTVGRFRRLPQRAPCGHQGFGVRRYALDHWLVQAAIAAGAQFLPRTEFVRLLRDADRVQGAILREVGGSERAVAADWVIGCDGVHSRVARDMGVQKAEKWLQQFGLAAHFTGVAPSEFADIQLLQGGFVAAATVDVGLTSVNLVLPRERLRERTSASWDEFLAQQLGPDSPLASRLKHATRITAWRGCGPLAHTTQSVWQPGVALVGDAAGYVDPMTGEGIYFALFGARAAAEAIAAACAIPAQAATALANYARARAQELGPRQRTARWLQRGIRSKAAVRAFLLAARWWPSLADLVVTLSGDTIHPRELLRARFWRHFLSAS